MALGTGRRALPSVQEIVEWAVWYAVELGWRVFPVQRSANPEYDKTPFTKHGFKDASTDEEVIRAWWRRYPTANIGLALPPGWLVVDVDAYHDGVQTLRDLETSYQPLPRTLTNLTGSGGGSAHYCFTMLPGHDPKGKLGEGLDIRVGEKNYIIIPPSIHISGGEYTWESDYGPEDIGPQPAPAWLLALLSRPSSNGNGHVFDQQDIIREGGRNNAYFTFVQHYHRLGVTEAPLRLMADEYNTHKLEPPLDDVEADRTFLSACRYEQDAQLMVPVGWSPRPSALSGTRSNNDAHWRAELFTKKNGELYPNAFNITHILRYSDHWRKPEYALWYDVLTSRHMIAEEQITRAMLVKISQWFGGAERMPLTSLSLLEECLYAQCEETKRDRIAIWLNALPPWDGTQRLDTWLMQIAHAEDDDIGYTRHIGRRFLLSMVARGLYPGCQYREVIVLEGPENIGKSHIVETLASKEFCLVLSMNLEAKEAHMMLQRAWLAELADLDSMNRTEEARLKAFITMEEDTYIPKYRNESISVPRRAVFVGTTNDRNYLKSLSGNTRFLPLWLPGPIDLDALRAMREQLFAEAKHEYHAAAEGWWQMTAEIAAEAQQRREGRRMKNPYEVPLRNWLGDRTETSWAEIAEYFLMLKSPEAWKDRSLQMQIGGALRSMGFETVDEWRTDDVTGKKKKWHGWRWNLAIEEEPWNF